MLGVKGVEYFQNQNNLEEKAKEAYFADSFKNIHVRTNLKTENF